MYPRTSRRNGCCSDQQSFHQLLKVVGENGLEWRAIVRKERLGGTKRLKKLFEQRKMDIAALMNSAFTKSAVARSSTQNHTLRCLILEVVAGFTFIRACSTLGSTVVSRARLFQVGFGFEIGKISGLIYAVCI